MLVPGALFAAAAACSDSTGNGEARAAARLQLVSGDEQGARAGTELPEPVVVRIVDSRGRPVRGQRVSFRVNSGGGTVSPGSAVTNSEGLAQTRWVLGTSASQQQELEVRATDEGVTALYGWFASTAVPGPAALVRGVRTVGIEGTVVTSLATPLGVLVTDEHGNGVSGVPVEWATVSGAGSLTPSSSQSNAMGRAETVWTAGTRSGFYTATATVAGFDPVTFFLNARAGAVVRLVAASITDQVALTNNFVPVSPTVRAVDEYDNPVPGVVVRWAVLTGDGFVGQQSTSYTTGTEGTAYAPWFLGPAGGVHSLRSFIGEIEGPRFTARVSP